MKRSVVGACAILIALVAGGAVAQSQEVAFAKVHAWGKDAIGLVRPDRWRRETGIAKVHSWVRINGKTCMRDHVHYGSGNGTTRAHAEGAAIRSWAEFTAWEYGNSWGRYSAAVSQNMKCSQRSGWSCDVQARPCRPY